MTPQYFCIRLDARLTHRLTYALYMRWRKKMYVFPLQVRARLMDRLERALPHPPHLG